MKFFANFTNLPSWKAEPLLQCTFSIMLSKCVFISLSVVLYSYSTQFSLFKNTIFDTILSVESTYSLQTLTHVLPHAQYSVLLQHESVTTTAVKALLVTKETILTHWYHHRSVARNLILT